MSLFGDYFPVVPVGMSHVLRASVWLRLVLVGYFLVRYGIVVFTQFIYIENEEMIDTSQGYFYLVGQPQHEEASNQRIWKPLVK